MLKTKRGHSQYEIQAAETLAKFGIKFRAAFIFHGPYWENDTESRIFGDEEVWREKCDNEIAIPLDKVLA